MNARPSVYVDVPEVGFVPLARWKIEYGPPGLLRRLVDRIWKAVRIETEYLYVDDETRRLLVEGDLSELRRAVSEMAVDTRRTLTVVRKAS